MSRPKVPALPNQRTSIRRAPAAAIASAAIAMATSRKTARPITQYGAAWSMAMLPIPMISSNRSAVGIEHLAELGHLVEVAGDVSVDEVRRAEEGE